MSEMYAVLIQADGDWTTSRVFDTERAAWAWAMHCASKGWPAKVYLGGQGGMQLQKQMPKGC